MSPFAFSSIIIIMIVLKASFFLSQTVSSQLLDKEKNNYNYNK